MYIHHQYFSPPPTLLPANKLYTSLLMSGLIHATGDYVLYHTFSRGGALRFFLLQIVGITFKDGVIAIFSRMGYGKKNSMSTSEAKLSGDTWVFAWFTFPCRYG